MAAGCGPAFAIPSPELVIGSLSSLSQLMALLTAALGGLALAGAGIGVRRAATEGAARFFRRAALALLALVCALGGLNLYQYWQHRTERLDRLQATLVRPSRDAGDPVLDPTLKELNYQQQVKHSRGISTAEVQALIDQAGAGQRDDVVLLDVRETAETDMGTLTGATVVRWPDLAKAKLELAGKKPIIFCHNGNRSHETCDALAAQGIDCRFMVGGLEKWVVESREMTGFRTRTIDDLRAIPRYRNDDVLLDTAEVKTLVEREKAIFVDVRYPGEFAARRLPNAINLPIRRLPMEELKARIAELPKQPIVLPCYDRRSCFFSEVMGLELDRAGHDVRGRYTLPWEYFSASARPPHVLEWQARAEQSLWTRAVDGLAGLVVWMGDKAGLAAALVLLALVSRILVLPFALKAERDQITARRVDGAYRALRERLRDDPVRLSRAIREFHREHGLTPGRNLIALLFLPVLALGLGAVQKAVGAAPGGFLWIPNLAEPDPLFVLPLLSGLALTLYLHIALARTARQRALVWALGLPVLAGGGAFLGAGVELYVAASALLLLLQRAFIERGAIAARLRGFGRPRDLVRLEDAVSLAFCGSKAVRLGRLKAAGLPVPEGIVLTPAFLGRLKAATPDQRRRLLDGVWQRLGATSLAVRSSAEGEDGAQNSFAGVFASVLRVDRPGLAHAIGRVAASFRSDRATRYGLPAGQGAILIQPMIEADYSGVLFTRAPDAGGQALVELVEGTAEGLVAGAATGRSFRFGRATGRRLGESRPPIDLEPLLRLGHRAEALFGAPQDIEWTYRDGSFLIVQSRDITAWGVDAPRAALEDERSRLLALAGGSPAGGSPAGGSPEEPVLVQNALSELLPRPTPLSLSLMQAIWAPGGSVDLACRSLGLAYRAGERAASPLVTVFGRLYVAPRRERELAPRLGAGAARRIVRRSEALEQHVRGTLLPTLDRERVLLEAADFGRLATPELVASLVGIARTFVERTYAEVEAVNIAAQICLDEARRRLAAAGLDPAPHLAPPETALARLLAEAARLSGEERRSLLRGSFGHRAVFDYELSCPRYEEDLASLDALVRANASWAAGSRKPVALPEGAGRTLARTVAQARRLQALKEDAKHVAMREIAVLRRAILALDERLGSQGLAFFLTLEELAGAAEGGGLEGLVALAEAREARNRLMAEVPPLPPRLTATALETLSLSSPRPAATAGGLVRGVRVSGSGDVQGRARVVGRREAENGLPIAGFQDGDIIVSPMLHPSWLPYLPRAGGLVCEVGGWLSHMAILAREYHVTLIVEAAPLDGIPDGALVRLNEDGSVDLLPVLAEAIPVLAAE